MDDKSLRNAVIAELDFQPNIDATNIGVAVEKDVVTLSGYLPNYLQKTKIVDAVRHLKGVHGIADEIEIRIPSEKKDDDDQIARRAIDIINWDVEIPDGVIKVSVHDGWVTLTGDVEWQFEKFAAESSVRRLSGVRGIINNIMIKPRLRAPDIKQRIEDALKRHAEVEARKISVQVTDDVVILRGEVDDWDELNAVRAAAWAAPGVRHVNDQLVVR